MADHHIAAFTVHLQDAAGDVFPDPFVEVLHRPQVDLRSRQKSGNADVHDQATANTLGNLSGDAFVPAMGLLDGFPGFLAIGAQVGDQRITILVLVQKLHRHGLSRHKRETFFQIGELGGGHQSLEFSTDVNHHAGIYNRHHAAFHVIALGACFLRHGILLQQRVHRVRAQVPFVIIGVVLIPGIGGAVFAATSSGFVAARFGRACSSSPTLSSGLRG